MQIKMLFILTLACLLATSCGFSNDSSLPTVAATETSTLIPTVTKTATHTNTPPPTETFTPSPTPTETVFALNPSFVVTDENGAPVLVDGRAQFNFEMEYDKLPDVKDLETLSGYEAWSPDFIRWLHTEYIPKLQVGGSPLVTPFDPNTVCQVPWEAPPKSGTMAYINLDLKDGVVCKVGTFPVRKIFVIKDNDRGLFTVTQQIYNETTKSFISRTTAFDQRIWSLLPVLMQENSYIGFSYGFNQDLTGEGYPVTTVGLLQSIHLDNGDTLYDPAEYDVAYQDGGIFNSFFDDHLTVGQHHTGIVVND